ncbi:MAG TPA: HlyD family efflux transporter periplasmic adaptor subunit [Opitutaceae bacterium]|nr:HlyD family efflux transporter periplasmic adaptor subunit [Opitutaceae bacterium]
MRPLLLLLVLVTAMAGCRRPAPTGWQGYLEGEFVYVASPLGGQVEALSVQKGARVAAGAPLFALERRYELAAQREAADRLKVAEARRDDLRKGARPTEVAAIEARREQAQAAAELSRRELARHEDLFKTGAIAANDLDRARLTHERNLRALAEPAAQLETAKLGGRDDALAAAEAEVAVAAAAKERADWAVAQKAQAATRGGLVFDTLFREGEYAPAGAPVVALLPPENLKVRFFVPESDFANLKAGERVRVAITGRKMIEAQVSFLSPRPEFTPPVLYNRENRSKLVFLVEAIFDPAVARDLHPGQPVDVTRR